MDRMFPEPKPFVKVDKFVFKDSKAPYDRYWNKDTDRWTGLLNASKFTKEEVEEFIQLPENSIVLNYDDVLKS